MKIVSSYLVLLVLSCIIYGQNNSEILAKFGDNKITAEDFKNRYELVPRIVRNANEDSAKANFLYSIIAERLLSEDACLHKMDTTEIFRSAYIPLEKMFIRDILYKLNVTNKINYTNEDVIEGISKSKIVLKTNIITASDSVTIFSYYKQLKSGLAINDFFIKNFGKIQPQYLLTFGQLENSEIENIVYSLQDKQFSFPVKVKTGWLIFYLATREPNPNISENLQNTVINTIKIRIEKKIADQFLSSILGKEKIEIDKAAFHFLVDSTANKFVKNYTTKDSSGFILSESAIWELLNSLTTEQKKQTVIKFNEEPAAVKDILYYLMQEPLVIKEVNKRTIGYALKNAMDLFIENELTARYGYKIDAQNLPEVKKDLARRKDNLLMQLYKLKLSEEIRSKLSKDFKTKTNSFNEISLHICEILTSNLNLIDTIFNKLKTGVSFESLAKEYTVRTKPNNTGDLGFISPSEYGDIGKIASTLSIGQIYGPIKTKEGYSIFKLLDKKEITTSIDSDNNKMLSRVIDLQVEEEIQKYISKLASKENVAINKSALKSIEVNNMNNLTYRLMGFGGRIIAEPLTYPMYEWIKYLNVPLF